MKNCILLLFLSTTSGCIHTSNNINTIALVTTRNFKGKIVIFFAQNNNVGDIRLINGKHFFFVKDDGIFFTTLPVGKGIIENYIDLGNKLIRVNYQSPMTIKEANDTSYQVLGGSYRGIFHFVPRKNETILINFLPFQANVAFALKDGWEIDDKTIDSIYTSKFDR